MDLQWIQSQYKVYTITQKGKKRQIEEPSQELKLIQRKLINKLENFPFHISCHSIKNKSISTNAAVHQQAKFLLKIDIKQCYQNTTEDKILKSYKTFKELDNEFLKNLSYCLWFDKKNNIWRLPTGAPTSPILCNIALSYIDKYLYDYCLSREYLYTRYMDDLCISTNKSRRDWDIKEKIEEFINTKTEYTINKKKSKWFTVNKDATEVTGVKLGTYNKVPRKFYRIIRAKLYNLAKELKSIDEETRGCIAYINSIDNNTYNYLINYYEKTINRYKDLKNDKINI